MNLNEYQDLAARTATFGEWDKDRQILYLTLGITGEAGEVAEKIKKIMRNDAGVMSDEKKEEIKKELGDVLWYLSQMSRVLGYSFEEVAQANIDKLADRAKRGVIRSEGDNR